VGNDPRAPSNRVRPLSGSALRRAERRFDLVLGLDLALAAGLAFMFCLSVAAGSLPSGRIALGWFLLIGSTVLALVLGLRLKARGRHAAATNALAAVGAPAALAGLAIAPVALVALALASQDLSSFRDWLGPGLRVRAEHWLTILAFLGVMVAAAVVAWHRARPSLALGVMIGAAALASGLLFGIAGGFLFRGAG
jgi:hypothetical protein